jgi:ribosomal protein L40E
MFAASDPNLILGRIAVGGLIIAGLWRLVVWVRDAPITAEPWGAEVEQKLSEPEAVEVCHRCFTEQPPGAWFCARCGCAVGPYNNLMPYVCIFSQGEVFRNGVNDKVRADPLTIIGYLFYSLANYAFFAPLYWIFFFKHLQQLKEKELGEPETAIEPPP